MKFTSTGRQLVEQGVCHGVLAEVYDRGEVETQWGKKHKVKFIYEIPGQLKEGTNIPLTVSIDFNIPQWWGPKSDLYKHVQSSLGRPFTTAEQQGVDADSLIGINNLLTIQHRSSGDKVYANIVGVMPLMGNMPVIPVSEYYVPFAEVLRAREERLLEQAAAAGTNTSAYVV